MRRWVHRVCVALTATLVAFIFSMSCQLAFTPSGSPGTGFDVPSNGALGIGFHLTTTYATVALAYADGTKKAITRVEVDEEYKSMMLRLSLHSSQHIHKPYKDAGEAIQDYLRQIIRRSREALGLPASADVGRLSKVIKELRKATELHVGHKISAATIAIPSIVALYEEDLRDAFTYASMQYVEIYPYFNHRRIHDTGAVYAGHHVETHSPSARTRLYETIPLETDDRMFLLAVEYTRNCLITSQAEVNGHFYAEEIPHFEDFNLGHDVSYEIDDYWQKVQEAIEKPVKASAIPRRISKVLVHGESSDNPRFIEVLKDAIGSITHDRPNIYQSDPVFIAAKGVAELGRRSFIHQDEPDFYRRELI